MYFCPVSFKTQSFYYWHFPNLCILESDVNRYSDIEPLKEVTAVPQHTSYQYCQHILGQWMVEMTAIRASPSSATLIFLPSFPLASVSQHRACC